MKAQEFTLGDRVFIRVVSYRYMIRFKSKESCNTHTYIQGYLYLLLCFWILEFKFNIYCLRVRMGVHQRVDLSFCIGCMKIAKYEKMNDHAWGIHAFLSVYRIWNWIRIDFVMISKFAFKSKTERTTIYRRWTTVCGIISVKYKGFFGCLAHICILQTS